MVTSLLGCRVEAKWVRDENAVWCGTVVAVYTTRKYSKGPHALTLTIKADGFLVDIDLRAYTIKVLED